MAAVTMASGGGCTKEATATPSQDAPMLASAGDRRAPIQLTCPRGWRLSSTRTSLFGGRRGQYRSAPLLPDSVDVCRPVRNRHPSQLRLSPGQGELPVGCADQSGDAGRESFPVHEGAHSCSARVAGCRPNELRNYTDPAMIGAVMTVSPTEVLLRWKNGTVYRFVQPNPQFTPQLESIIDPNGNTITITRNPNNPNQVSQITDPVRPQPRPHVRRRQPHHLRDGPHWARGQVHLQRRGHARDRDGSGRRRHRGTSTDAANRMIRETDRAGIVVAENTYDANGRVATQTQADGGVFRFDYTFVNPVDSEEPRSDDDRHRPARQENDPPLHAGWLPNGHEPRQRATHRA